jgi:Tol biopolymer transport system component
VQRWETEEGLPIHRIRHLDGNSIYAFKKELDAWQASRSHLPENHSEDAGVNGTATPNANPPNQSPAQTPTGFRLATEDEKPPAQPFSWQVEPLRQPRRRLVVALTVVFALAATTAIALLTLPAPSVQILNYTQLTHDGRWKIGLATDGASAYFVEPGTSGRELCKLSLQSGEISRVPISLPLAALIAVSPDGAKLLIGEFGRLDDQSNAWVFSSTGKVLHRMTEGTSGAFAWAPANKIVYARGSDIWTSNDDGTHEAHVFHSSGFVEGVGWSPDAKRIWYTAAGPGASPVVVGEVDADGGGQRRVLEEKVPGRGFCCGFWSASGASFGFMSISGHLTSLLRVPDSPWTRFLHRQPISRTVFSLSEVSGFAADSAHSRFLVLSGGPWHADVFRFSPATGRFVPYFDGISARDIDFSPDGQSAVYVDGYDGSVWRYDLQKRRKTRLTGPPFFALLPRWSPDGKWIALTGGNPEGRWRIYRLPAQGGTPERLIANDENEGAPTWSPDGKSIAFGKVDCSFHDQCGVYRYDLVAHRLHMLPGSKGLRTARWSPDGKYIAALRSSDRSLMLFDFATQQWRRTYGPVLGDVVNWSRDSRYVYVYGLRGDNPLIFRVSVTTGGMEEVADLKGLESPGQEAFQWFGLAPDNSPIISRETAENELFSVSYQMP